jgi:hypothetical protein
VHKPFINDVFSNDTVKLPMPITLRIFIFFMLLMLPTIGMTQQRLPTFKECQKLASVKTSPDEKAQLTQMFKTNGMYCAMQTNPFSVSYVFTNGQGKAQLRLQMQKNNRYAIDNKSMMDILLPDRAGLSLPQIIMFGGQIVNLLTNVMNANIDPMQVKHVSGRVGALAAGAGANARIALQQMVMLRDAAHLQEQDIEIPSWFLKLSTIPAATVAPQHNSLTATGPEWMQKAMGGIQHLMGSFSGGDSGE